MESFAYFTIHSFVDPCPYMDYRDRNSSCRKIRLYANLNAYQTNSRFNLFRSQFIKTDLV
jgi:hypothetical protein